MKALVALLPMLGGCFFGHDHDHGGGHEHEREPLPDQVSAANAEAVLAESLRRVNGGSVAEGVVFRPWRKAVEGRTVLAGIERVTARSGPEGAWTRIPFQKIRKVHVAAPAQGGLKLWGLTLEGESMFGSGDSPQGESSSPFSLWSVDGEAVKALAASVERLRNSVP